METFLTADDHFDHDNIFRYTQRKDIWSRPEECWEALVANWNAKVGRKDRTIIVGDFAFRNHARWANRLNGKKILVLGSHDKASLEVYRNCFMEVVPRKTMVIKPWFLDINHCCQRVWERAHYGSIHVFGHSHGHLRTWNLSFDVGVDVPENNYAPLHCEELFQRARVRTEEMCQAGRIREEEKNGRRKTIFFADDLAYFNHDARVKPDFPVAPNDYK